jgi:hypothetical protein
MVSGQWLMVNICRLLNLVVIAGYDPQPKLGVSQSAYCLNPDFYD